MFIVPNFMAFSLFLFNLKFVELISLFFFFWLGFGFSADDLKNVLPEGLPPAMEKEVKESLRSAVLVRQSFLDLRDNFRRVVDPTLSFPKSKGLSMIVC